jgi:hypothetical protein
MRYAARRSTYAFEAFGLVEAGVKDRSLALECDATDGVYRSPGKGCGLGNRSVRLRGWERARKQGRSLGPRG